jgi:hypothetical protein
MPAAKTRNSGGSLSRVRSGPGLRSIPRLAHFVAQDDQECELYFVIQLSGEVILIRLNALATGASASIRAAIKGNRARSLACIFRNMISPTSCAVERHAFAGPTLDRTRYDKLSDFFNDLTLLLRTSEEQSRDYARRRDWQTCFDARFKSPAREGAPLRDKATCQASVLGEGARALPVVRAEPSRNAASENYGRLGPPYLQ